MKKRITTTRQSLKRQLANATKAADNLRPQINDLEAAYPDFAQAKKTMGLIQKLWDDTNYNQYRELQYKLSNYTHKVNSLQTKIDQMPLVAPDEIITGNEILDCMLKGTLTMVGKRRRFVTLYDYQWRAEGRCPYASEMAVKEFQEIGEKYFPDNTGHLYCSVDDHPNNLFYMGKDEHGLRQISPDLLGYGDRPVAGQFKGHIVAVYEDDDEYFTIDFTARQYGYDAFPLIQKFSDDKIWRLDNQTSEWSLIGPIDWDGIRARKQAESAVGAVNGGLYERIADF